MSPEIEASLQKLAENLNARIPLRHHCEFVDAKKMNCELQAEKDKAIQNFRKTVLIHKIGEEKREFAEKFHSEVDKLVEEYQNKNDELKTKAQSMLKKRVEDLCEDFKSSTESKLFRSHDMTFETAEAFVKSGKELAKSNFNYHSSYGNDGLYNKERMEEEELLVQKLTEIEKTLLKQRRRNQRSISNEEESKSLEEKATSLLKKRMADLCADLKSTIEIRLLIAPDLDLKSLKDLLKTGKELAKRYFEYHSNFGKVGLFNEEKMKAEMLLEQELERLGSGIIREQRRHLRSILDKEAGNLLETLKTTVLEMSDKVKANSRQWSVTQRKLKEKIQEIHKYVEENGVSVMSDGNNREIYLELLRTEAGENMSAEEFIEWTEGLTKEVKIEIEDGMEMAEMHFLESDSDEDAPVVEGNIELELNEEVIKEEILERGDEVHDSETPQEMDIDIKIELDGLVLQKSCLKATRVEKPCHNQNLEIEDQDRSSGNNIESSYKRKKLSKTQTNPRRSNRLKPTPPNGLLQKTKLVKKKRKQIDYNVPTGTGDFLLLQAIRYGETTAYVKKMLDAGANVNVKSIQDGDNAAHEVFSSHYLRRRPKRSASILEMLNLLLDNGFTLINEKNTSGSTPLYRAICDSYVNEELLKLFYKNGADFNERDTRGESLLLFAISLGRGEEIIRKIIEFGGDPNPVDAQKAVEYAARRANTAAMEILIDRVDVNAVNGLNWTLLHLLFSEYLDANDYLGCLEILLRKGADFDVKCSRGNVPLVKWILFSPSPFGVFEALLEVRDTLPITQEIASAALMAMAIRVSPLSSLCTEYIEFFVFLIEEKDAKLLLKDEGKWKLLNWDKFSKLVLTRDFSNQLKIKTTGRLEWKGDLIKIESKDLHLGLLDFHSKSAKVSVSIEMALNCMLASRNEKAFLEVCHFLYDSGMYMIPSKV